MNLPTTVEQIAREMFLSAGRFAREQDVWTAELARIFGGAERNLVSRRESILAALTVGQDGKLVGEPEALARINALTQDIRQSITDDLVNPSRAWVDERMTVAWKRGRRLARVNLTNSMIDRDLVRESFLHVRPAERGVLAVGLRDTYRITETVGDDVAEFFRSTMTQSAILGLPVQGPGDTLSNRLFRSGRLAPIEYRTSDGRLVRRSLRQRAVAIARVETAKIFNRVHETKAVEVLGDEAVFANANPEDSRTTPICDQATDEEPKSLSDWDSSPYGRPPRLKPDFHLCRSFLMGGTRAMFEETNHPSVASAVKKAREDAGAGVPGGEPSDPEKEPDEKKFRREVDELVRRSAGSERDMIAVGNRIRQEFDTPRMQRRFLDANRRRDEAIEALTKQVHEADRATDAAGAIMKAGYSSMSAAEFKSARRNWEKARRRSSELYRDIQLLKARKDEFRGKAIRELLAEIRPMGHAGGDTAFAWRGRGTKTLKATMDEAADFIPTDWLRASAARGPMTLKKVKRGYYQDSGETTIAISGSGRSATSTALHELGHRAEYTFRDILEANAEFYEKRTAGEASRRFGVGYGRNEVYKPDKFTERYIGKDYGKRIEHGRNPDGSFSFQNTKRWEAFEILTMGLEGVFFGKYNLLAGDPEMFDLILGLLAAGGKL